MNISDQYHKIILDEFNNIKQFCNDAKSPKDKLYFFSACHGIINRVMNFQCNPTLIFMHQILQSVYQALSQRLDASKIQGNISNSFPEEMSNALLSYLTELISAFEKREEAKIREVLEKFSNLAYAVTGNGFYLYLQKKLIL